MVVKGTAVKSIPEYVKSKYPDLFDTWIEKLSEESREIFNNPIFSSNWYDADASILNPIIILSDLVKKEINKLAFEMGIFSCNQAINGIYKIFIKVANPNFVVNRSSNIISTYYKDTIINIIDNKNNYALLELLNFDKKYTQVIYRIAGWIYSALEIVGQKNIKVEINQIEDNPPFKTIIKGTWE